MVLDDDDDDDDDDDPITGGKTIFTGNVHGQFIWDEISHVNNSGL